MEIKINTEEVFNYFTDLITDKETWNGDEEQNKTMHSFISGALSFCTTFGILTNDEYIELECLEIPTETEEHKITCTDCPYYYSDDDGEEYSSCHYEGEDNYAPCSYEEPEESYEEDYYYEEESWGYEDRNYQRLYE